MALKRSFLKTIVCLSAGVFLLVSNCPAAGGRAAGAAGESLLNKTAVRLPGEGSAATGSLWDPATGLPWLIEGLLARDPGLKVEPSSRIIHNGSQAWKQIWLKGDAGDLKTVADFLENSRKSLKRKFNCHFLINFDEDHGSLRFLVLDGFEVVVVASLTARNFRPHHVTETGQPKLAIIIDDFGRSLDSAEKFASLALPLTFAVFPKLSTSSRVAHYFIARRCDIMLHMPMEPRGYPSQNPGPGALFMFMDEEQVKRVFIDDLNRLPGIIGVNNHMGSRLTTDRGKMNQVMSVLKGRGLFFIDSRTTADSVAFKSAVSAGIPALQRDVFLDNERDVTKIIRQFRLLIEIARVKKRAVGIGHPYPETLKALKRFTGIAESAGVEIVAVRKLLPGCENAVAR